MEIVIARGRTRTHWARLPQARFSRRAVLGDVFHELVFQWLCFFLVITVIVDAPPERP